MSIWFVLLPLIAAIGVAAGVGLVFDRLQRSRANRIYLLRRHQKRAKAALDYFNEVHDSTAG